MKKFLTQTIIFISFILLHPYNSFSTGHEKIYEYTFIFKQTEALKKVKSFIQPQNMQGKSYSVVEGDLIIKYESGGLLGNGELMFTDFDVFINGSSIVKHFYKGLCNNFWEIQYDKILELRPLSETRKVLSLVCSEWIDGHGYKYYCTDSFPVEVGLLRIKNFKHCIIGMEDDIKTEYLTNYYTREFDETQSLKLAIKDIPELEQPSLKSLWISDKNSKLSVDTLIRFTAFKTLKNINFTNTELGKYNCIILYVIDHVGCRPSSESNNTDVDARNTDLDLLESLVKHNKNIIVFAIFGTSAEVMSREFAFVKNHVLLNYIPSGSNWMNKHEIQWTPSYYVLDSNLKIRNIFHDTFFNFNDHLEDDLQKVISSFDPKH